MFGNRPAQLISARFEHRVMACSTRVAVKSVHHELSYAALDARANGIADAITRVSGNKNEPIILMLVPDAPLVSGILGVLKAGKICVPQRPTQPIARFRHVLENTGARVVITEEDNVAIVSEARRQGCHVIEVEDCHPRPTHDSPRFPCDSAAYIFYTSGSTGKPKGVLHTHRTLLHLVDSSTGALSIEADDRIALMPSSSFIGAARNIFGALLNGASLYPFDVNAEGLDRFAKWLVEQEITIYHFVPTFYRHFVASLDGQIRFPKLRLVYLGGEPVRKTDVDSFRKYFAPEAILVNGYGATETGAIRRCFIDRHTQINEPRIPVGYPVADKQVLILDENGRRLGPGQVGEIAVRSRYLSPGYWRDPQASCHAFSNDPGDSERRTFRTGDLGRLSSDGCLDHLGRLDSQIKIRGHRVDLTDVQAALLSLPSTADVAVVTRTDRNGELKLVAYLVSRAASKLSVGEVRRGLGDVLPSYAIPTSYVFIDEIPRTPRGKVDKSALPDPPAARPELDNPRVFPRTELERSLTQLWCEMLEIDMIGVDDNFFELGGESLSAARILNRIQTSLDSSGQYVYMTALFEGPTVAQFASYLERNYPEIFGPPRHHKSLTIARKQTRPVRSLIDESALIGLRRQIASAYPDNDWESIDKNAHMVFVLCSSRSGSTLFRVMLGGHPQLFAPPELRLLGYRTLAERKAAHSGEDAMMLEGAVRAIMQVSGRSADDTQDLIRELTECETTTANFYRLLQEWVAPAILVDKTPSYSLHPPALANAEAHFDDPYYIHLVRHPCGVIRSGEEMRLDLVSPFRHMASSASELAEILWVVSHQNILRFLEHVPARRRQRVRFEDLVREPEVVMRNLCDWLNLEFHSEMLRPYGDSREKMTDGIHPETRMIGDIRFHEHRCSDPLVADSWKTQVGKYQLSETTRDLAETMGYQRIDVEKSR